MPNTPDTRLSPKKLIRKCAEEELVEREVADDTCSKPELFIGCGQDRFLHSLLLATQTDDAMHNVYVPGLSGSAGFEIIEGHLKQILQERQDNLPEPDDWCYVYNFESPRYPLPIPLKKGTARQFQKKIKKLLNRLKERVPEVLQNERLIAEKNKLEQEFSEWQEQGVADLEEIAHQNGFKRINDDDGSISFLPYKKMIDQSYEGEDDKVFEVDEISKFPVEKQALLNTKFEEGIGQHLRNQIKEQAQKMQEMREAKELLNQEYVTDVVERLFAAEHKNIDQEHPQSTIRVFFEGLKQHSIDNFHIFVKKPEQQMSPMMLMMGSSMGQEEDPFLPWSVNIFVDNKDTKGVPIVSGRVSSLEDLSGHIEHTVSMGSLYTNHMKIYAGMFAEANGGYLILNARNVLLSPYLWQFVKRVIQNQEITIETPASLLGMGQQQLKPAPIQMNVRIILFGPSWLMGLLANVDDELAKLFKIRAEVLPFVDRTKEQVSAYYEWINKTVLEESLHSLSKAASCKIIEYAGRLSGSQDRLSTDFDAFATVLKQADALAPQGEDGGSWVIDAEHIQKALDQKFWRSSFVYDYIHDSMRRNMLLISTTGEKEGQINALVVQQHSDVRFGFPSRITASVNVGKPDVVNIHRDADAKVFAGASFKKADLTVQGLLKRNFAQEYLLALEIHFSFEQTYVSIDGDSASLAEYFVILSAISGIPIKQSVAITGSVNLLGEIQPIGGANEKIEGFFHACKALGDLTGEQGVIIPHQNNTDLMLHEDVRKAVEDEKFNIWPIDSLEHRVDILMGVSSEELKAKVNDRLSQFSKRALEFLKLLSSDTSD